MEQMTKYRILAGGVVFSCLLFYALYSSFHETLHLPSFNELITQPIIAKEEKKTELISTVIHTPPPITEKQEDKVSAVQIDQLQIASGSMSLEPELGELPATEKKVADGNPAIEVSRPEMSPAAHAGIVQDGLTLTGLELRVTRNDLFDILKQGNGYLIAVVGGKRYLLRGSGYLTFAKVNIDYADKQVALSARCIAVGNLLEPTEKKQLANKIRKRTGNLLKPVFQLQFSTKFDHYLASVQQNEMQRRGIDPDSYVFDNGREFVFQGKLEKDVQGRMRLIVMDN